jgi:hypothetical protein
MGFDYSLPTGTTGDGSQSTPGLITASYGVNGLVSLPVATALDTGNPDIDLTNYLPYTITGILYPNGFSNPPSTSEIFGSMLDGLFPNGEDRSTYATSTVAFSLSDLFPSSATSALLRLEIEIQYYDGIGPVEQDRIIWLNVTAP